MNNKNESNPPENDQSLPPIEIPPASISEEALCGVIDNFIVREGTDYGWVEASYESKVEKVMRQIRENQIKITFDPNTETVSLMTLLQWKLSTKGTNHV